MKKNRSSMILTQPEVEKGGVEHVETEKSHRRYWGEKEWAYVDYLKLL